MTGIKQESPFMRALTVMRKGIQRKIGLKIYIEDTPTIKRMGEGRDAFDNQRAPQLSRVNKIPPTFPSIGRLRGMDGTGNEYGLLAQVFPVVLVNIA